VDEDLEDCPSTIDGNAVHRKRKSDLSTGQGEPVDNEEGPSRKKPFQVSSSDNIDPRLRTAVDLPGDLNTNALGNTRNIPLADIDPVVVSTLENFLQKQHVSIDQLYRLTLHFLERLQDSEPDSTNNPSEL
jgi:hypothetical protein